MSTTLHRMFDSVLQLSSGRRIVVYQQARPVAERLGQPRIVLHIDTAIAHDQRTRELEDRWSSRGRTLYIDRVPVIDIRADTLLTSIRDTAEAQARGLAPSSTIAIEAARLTSGIFPNGVGAITMLPFVDQIAAMENIMRKLQGELASAVRVLGLEHKVAELAAITLEYRQAVNQTRNDLEFATVREARELGHTYLLEMIAMVLGTYANSRDPRQVAAREELLAPVVEQMTAMRVAMRARRRARAGMPDEPVTEPPADDMDGSAAGDEVSAAN